MCQVLGTLYVWLFPRQVPPTCPLFTFLWLHYSTCCAEILLLLLLLLLLQTMHTKSKPTTQMLHQRWQQPPTLGQPLETPSSHCCHSGRRLGNRKRICNYVIKSGAC
jgi:hypothetical protein